DLGDAGPDLLAVHDVVVAGADRARAQRGEVGARAGLREALAPDLVAAEDLGHVPRLLLRGALRDQRRPAVQESDEVHADVRRPGARDLLVVDELLGEREIAAAVLARPVDPRVAGVEEPALPAGVVGAARAPVVAGRRRAVRGNRLGEPCAQLGAELLVGLRVAQLQGGSRRRCGGAEHTRWRAPAPRRPTRIIVGAHGTPDLRARHGPAHRDQLLLPAARAAPGRGTRDAPARGLRPP